MPFQLSKNKTEEVRRASRHPTQRGMERASLSCVRDLKRKWCPLNAASPTRTIFSICLRPKFDRSNGLPLLLLGRTCRPAICTIRLLLSTSFKKYLKKNPSSQASTCTFPLISNKWALFFPLLPWHSPFLCGASK